ncbi:MAG: DUF2062 domain-containing protein [Betaproteobacteria bacterium]|nr:DUF2062 domain-containing protein [Betaproteobacteria bacterium]
MPRKFFRKYLPSHAAISENHHIARFGSWLRHHNLWHLHRRSVAGGVAAGMFAGLIPGSNPVQFTVAALLAVVFRVNLPIAVIVTLYSNPFTIVPLYYLAFKLGQLALLESDGGLPPLAFGLEGKGFSEWLPAALDWLTSIGKPLLVGLPLLALLLSAISYVMVRWAWRCYVVCTWRARQSRRLAQGTPPQ